MRPGEAAHAGQQIIESAILTALAMGEYFPPETPHGNIVEAIVWALEEAGFEDHDALFAAAATKLGAEL